MASQTLLFLCCVALEAETYLTPSGVNEGVFGLCHHLGASSKKYFWSVPVDILPFSSNFNKIEHYLGSKSLLKSMNVLSRRLVACPKLMFSIISFWYFSPLVQIPLKSDNIWDQYKIPPPLPKSMHILSHHLGASSKITFSIISIWHFRPLVQISMKSDIIWDQYKYPPLFSNPCTF